MGHPVKDKRPSDSEKGLSKSVQEHSRANQNPTRSQITPHKPAEGISRIEQFQNNQTSVGFL